MNNYILAKLAKRATLRENGEVTVVDTPAGEIAYFPRATPPTGRWLEANGDVISRTTYADLFAAIGTTFGAGDGSTTFKLPDLRGEFIRGLDQGRGVDTGRALGSAQADELKSHTHQIGEANASDGTAGDGPYIIDSATGTETNSVVIAKATGGTETRPRNIALLACIRY